MLSRRHLRIKVMQGLYAYYQSEIHDMNKSEKQLFSSIEKMHDTYLYLLLIGSELAEAVRINVLDSEKKYVPKKNDPDTNPAFAENKLVKSFMLNQDFLQQIKQKKISWQKENELVRKLFSQLKKTPEYLEYIKDANSFETDKEFILWVYKKFLFPNELLNNHLEEKNIHWIDDQDFVNSMVIKTLKSVREDEHGAILSLFKDEEDDLEFTTLLFKKTIENNDEYEKMISDKTQNWDVERIALTDIILMKMAITEIIEFSSIPVKVSINEYIDISKDYSTPKSKVFINGVIDKIVADLKDAGRIHKSGRGLLE